MRIIPAGCDVELRPVAAGDADALFAAVERNRERLRRWLPWITPDYSRDDVGRFLAEKHEENCSGVALTTAIWSGDNLCGAIGLHRIDARHRSSSIGYWIDAAYEGRGIVTRACRAIVDEAFGAYGLHRIEIRCATCNSRSAAIASNLGFVLEGTLREAEWLHDRWVDLYVFRMLEHEWSE